MDDTFFMWTVYLNMCLLKEFPGLKTLPRIEQSHYLCHKNYPDQYTERIGQIWKEPEFYKNLEPMPGAQAAFWWLLEHDFEVHFVTTPVPGQNRGLCMKEKHDSLTKHLNEAAAEYLTLVNDKTTVLGDFLIDDKPDIDQGRYVMNAKHLLFDQGHLYNISNPYSTFKPRINWDNFPEKFMAYVERYYYAKK